MAVASLYSPAFFDAHEKSSLESARSIVPLVCDLIGPKSVVDIGCGRGTWLSVFLEHGIEHVVGYDGEYVDPSQLLIPRTSFYPADLSKGPKIVGQYDLAICLEVAEHLPLAVSRTLVDALCEAAPAVLFSAAIPGQGGTHHINEQWPEFWADQFLANGFERLDPIRPAVFADTHVAPWYKQNTYLYVHRAHIDRDGRLRRERDCALRRDVQVIASQRLIPLKSVQGLAGELLRAIARSIRRRVGL